MTFEEQLDEKYMKIVNISSNYKNWMVDLSEIGYDFAIADKMAMAISTYPHLYDLTLLYSKHNTLVLKPSGRNKNTFTHICERLCDYIIDNPDLDISRFDVSVVGCKNNPVAYCDIERKKKKEKVLIEPTLNVTTDGKKYLETKMSHVAIKIDGNNMMVELNNKNSNVIKKVNDVIDKLKDSNGKK